MKVIGFNFTKMHAEKHLPVTKGAIENNIQFTDLVSEKLDLLKEDQALKISFKYSLIYTNKDSEKEAQEDKAGEIHFEGHTLLSVGKDEAKEFQKSWKKKQLPQTAAATLGNIIFKRCTIKSIPFQEELNLPSPFLKLPQA